MKVVFSPRCLEYESAGHPEAPWRVERSYQFLREKGYECVALEPAQESDVLLVHTRELVEQVKRGTFFDIDTPNVKHIYEYALLSVGGAVGAVEFAATGEKAFSLMRPPGHHAGKDSLGGFCYFNNIAVAVQKIIAGTRPDHSRRVAIVDIDCHHGQGTEEIFRGVQDVLYFSLHQAGIYPGTGFTSTQNALNFPLEAGTGPKEYLATLEKGLEKVREFKPNLIAVSAGFDTYKEDPLTAMRLELDTYREIGTMIAELNLPTFAVLEGGYSKELPSCVYNFLVGLESS